jgi:branched-chain amino acid transport system ATP-binding protein
MGHGGAFSTAGSGALEISDVAVNFGGLRVLQNVTMRVPCGSAVGLVGPNGAGKTTLFNVVSGFVRPIHGTVHCFGRDMSRWPAYRRARGGIARSFQQVGLHKGESVLENFRIALEVGSVTREASFAFLGARRAARGDNRQTLQELLELLELEHVVHERVRDLSAGTAKAVEIGCLLMRDPSLLLLDEPSSGVAKSDLGHVLRTLDAVRQRSSISILMIEHDMNFVSQAVDHMYVLHNGTILTEGKPGTVLRDPAVAAVYLGSAALEAQS